MQDMMNGSLEAKKEAVGVEVPITPQLRDLVNNPLLNINSGGDLDTDEVPAPPHAGSLTDYC